MAAPQPTDPHDASRRRVVAHPRRGSPRAIAAAMANSFRNRRLTVGQSRIRHAVAWRAWLDDEVLPAPACRQGFDGDGTHAELAPSELAVTCVKCRRLRPETIPSLPRQDVLIAARDLEQGALF